jgi:hypothetical protein
MFPRVPEIGHVKDYRLKIQFSEGTVAELDFSRRVTGRGGVFEPLADVEFFKRVTVDREAGTLVWPNGVDFCPDVLYADATGKPIEQMDSRLEVV